MVVGLRGDRRMYRAAVGVESKASDTPMVKRVMMAKGGGGTLERLNVTLLQ